MSVTTTVANGAPRFSGYSGLGAYSLMARLYPTAHPDWGALLSVWQGGVNGNMLQFSGATNDLVLATGFGTTALASGLSLNTWYDVALTYSGVNNGAGSLVGYVRATGDAGTITTASRAGVDIDPATIFLGASADGEYVEGRRCDLRLWDGVVLTPDEIAAEFARLTPARLANLYLWWPLLDANDTRDLSGNGRGWSNGGTAPTTADHPPVPWRGRRTRLVYAPAGGGSGTQYNQSVGGDLTPAGALVRETRRALGGSFTPAATVAGIKTALQAVAGGVAPSGALARQTGKALAGATVPAGTVVKQTGRALAGTVTPAGTLNAGRIVAQALTGALSVLTGALAAVYNAGGGVIAAVQHRIWMGHRAHRTALRDPTDTDVS